MLPKSSWTAHPMRKIAAACIVLALAVLLSLLNLAACAGPSYYAQAVSGHFQIMRQREEIRDILTAEDTDADLKRKLQLALEIRQFATLRLDLPANGSFSRFARTGREAVTWNVVATPELSLEPRRWCFLVAGCVPYRGYFEQGAATEFANELAGSGYDVDVSPALAYSTLGWFEDPLLDTMLRYSEADLAAVIFHELAHQKLYLGGDTLFSESYASFVEEVGVAQWLRAAGREDRLPAWLQRRQAAAEFDNLLLQTRADLAKIYDSAIPEKQKRRSKAAILGSLEADYRHLVDGRWHGRDYFADWFAKGVNNARLALRATYRGGHCAFSSLYEEVGEDIERFHALAAEAAKLSSAARQRWLAQPCPAVAPQDDL